ncbi:SusC/RagA family TonB-linked outer membrane protein [Membranihabitans maritimus]|uniref:SusC/RagA family TonB-linked outer membrane protein n=1 Tax=Membranihabitans maritimus TaxID=2904244 RepID=UPI001F02FDB2|nr:SusC/RagA family TonB-linked outer membrane protein [Membranihabitans maritimus]
MKLKTQKLLKETQFFRLSCASALNVITLLLFFTATLDAQITVEGTVTDKEGEVLIGVNVQVKGTSNGASTDFDGNYTLENVDENAILMFSYVGYQQQEIAVEGESEINATMLSDAELLEEVVVVGYGTARKKDLTGSVVNVEAEKLMKYQPNNMQELLRSSVPGLKVGYSTSAKNTPDFEIRGDNTIKAEDDDGTNAPEISANRPLIVLDGVIFNGDIAEINVNDIASIDVLKDASAASIYGSRASNGVIMVTTKKGTSSKPTVNASVKLGVVTGAKRINTFKAGNEVMTWLTDMNESINSLSQEPWSKYDKYETLAPEYQDDWLQANGIPGETDPTVITTAWLDAFGFEGNEKENYLMGREFDWQDWLFHSGIRQDYDVSVSGRKDDVSYYWSLGYLNNESVQIGEKFSTVTSRLNLDVKATNFLNLGINANFAYQDEGNEPIDNGGYRTASPYDAPWVNDVYNENIPEIGDLPNRYPREYLKTAGAGSNRGNPFLDPAFITRKYDRFRIFPTMYAKLSLPFDIKFTSRFTTRLDFRERLYYEDSENPNWAHGGYARRQGDKTYEWQLDNILNWTREFGDHRIDFTGLVNAESRKSWYNQAASSNFSPTQALGYHGLVFGLVQQTDSGDEIVNRNALMGRISYGFGNKYNLSVSVRRDGYSRFGSESKYAVFPSISGAWNISSEEFMSGMSDWMTFLKLRASWGVNGNSSGLGSYAAYATLSDNKYLNYDNGYFVAPYLYINRMANPNLAWEKNQAWNFGLDYGLFSSRVRGAIDIYKSKTTDLLLDKKLPIVTGFNNITTNVGSLENVGVDLSINTINIENAEFSWTSNLNLSYNNNKIVSLTGEKVELTDENGNTYLGEPDDIDNGWFIGQNKDVIWDFELDGVYSVAEADEAAQYGLYPGDFRMVDQNNDGVLNANDKVFQGLSKNPWYVTLGNEFQYKGFDLGIILLAKMGYSGGSDLPFNNQQSYIKNHNWYNIPYWTPNNQISNAARINSIRIGEALYYQSKSYLRIQNISVGYTLPPQLLQNIKLNSTIRLGFTVDNVGIITNWILGDPESEREMPRIFSFNVNTTL